MSPQTHDHGAEVLPLEDSTDLLLALLYAPGKSGTVGEPIDGRTRIQKLVFLLQQDVGPQQLVEEAKEVEYTPHKMGPYSIDLAKVLEELVSAGIVKTERLEYVLTDDSDPESDKADVDSPGNGDARVQSLRYRLSEFGMEIAERIWLGLPGQMREELSDFKSFFNSLKLRQLLIFTYDRYPQYTIKSIIREDLGY